jgi:hypothetical protein
MAAPAQQRKCEAMVSKRMRRFETHLILGLTLVWTLALVEFAQLYGWS